MRPALRVEKETRAEAALFVRAVAAEANGRLRRDSLDSPLGYCADRRVSLASQRILRSRSQRGARFTGDIGIQLRSNGNRGFGLRRRARGRQAGKESEAGEQFAEHGVPRT